ncbi:MAG TPA: phosphopantetheine-binding protein [Hyphomicrobiaceae bacterium]|jgi:acyl carrier protein|nr:phosphopantetheine-binding protein [Hyphomicrobiaceae bacterium]
MTLPKPAMDDLAAKTVTLLKPYLRNAGDGFVPDARLSDLGIDPLDLPILALDIEDAFDIDIGYDEIGRVETIRGVVERVRSRVAAKRQARSRTSSEAGRRTSSAWLRASLKS